MVIGIGLIQFLKINNNFTKQDNWDSPEHLTVKNCSFDSFATICYDLYMDYEVIDNFLTTEQHKELYDWLLTSRNFPWFYNPTVVGTDAEKETEYQFTHIFYLNGETTSTFFPLVEPILEKLNVLTTLRIKANLSPRTIKNIESGYHIDTFEKSKTIVYYVNSNNGYTKFENGDKVESIENRLLIFDSSMSHTGASCTDEKVRSVINFNIIQK